MLRFGHPEYLWLLLLVLLLGVGFVAAGIFARRRLHRFVDAALVPQVAADAGRAKRMIKHALVLCAAAFLILAFADPLVGTRIEDVKRQGIDLFVALDVSLSMKAEDIRPSRLEKAKRDVSDLLRRLSGDRVGLIVFAGDAFVQFPLTSDYSAADLFLSAVDVNSVPVPGTMIGSAIDLALKSFPTDVPTKKAIVIVTDGENTEGDVMGAVEDAKKAGVRIYGVGMGTPEGGPIPVLDANGTRTDYKRDRAGSIVLSKLDESSLQQIAGATGGAYYRGTSGGNEIGDVYNKLATLEKAEFGTKQVAGFETRYQIPLAIALLLLIVDFLLSERSGKLIERLKKLAKFGSAAAVLTLLLIPVSVKAQTVRGHVKEGNRAYESGKYPDAEAEYKKALEKQKNSKEANFDLGNAYYKQQRFDEATKQYGHSATLQKKPEERSASLYNIGNAMYRSNKYAESVEAYKRALRLNPNDDDARYNLLMAKEKLKQQQQQQKQQQQNQQNKQDQQQQQQQQPQQQKQDQSRQDQSQAQQRKQQMPKEEADRILDAMKNNERDVQKQLHKREAVRVRVEKDW